MAIDPRISLAIKTPDTTTNAINIFENALNNAQVRNVRQQGMAQNQQQMAQADLMNPMLAQQAQQNLEINSQNIALNKENANILSIAEYGETLKPALMASDPARVIESLTTRLGSLPPNADKTQTLEALAMAQQGNLAGIAESINTTQSIAANRGLFGAKPGQRGVSTKSYAPVTDTKTGQRFIETFDANTGTTNRIPVKGSFQETPAQIEERNLLFSTKKKRMELAEGRTSTLKQEYSTQRRQAKNSARKLREVQKLSEGATQGVGGRVLLGLAKIFPGIDVKDEAALSSAYKNLALDELQKFKGPTTDFEFRVTEDIAGSLGDGAFANQARTASLLRASWFSDKQAQQFDKWIDGGHSPDRYSFDMNEPISFGTGDNKKTYTLQSLQDTAAANHLSIEDTIKKLKSIGGK